MKEETSAGIIVFVDSAEGRKYLILHYEEGHYDLPKGHLEGSETPMEAAIRETREETGLITDIIPGFEESISYFFTGKDRKKIHKKVIFFVGRAKSEKVRLSSEHIGYEWLPYEDALKRATFDSAKDLAKKAEYFLKKTG